MLPISLYYSTHKVFKSQVKSSEADFFQLTAIFFLRAWFDSWKNEVFSSPQQPDQLWANPASYTMDTGSISLGVKRQGRETDRSTPSSAEVKNGGAIPLLPHTSSWRVAQLFKHRDSFAFHL
jgi:hypothetical protein